MPRRRSCPTGSSGTRLLLAQPGGPADQRGAPSTTPLTPNPAWFWNRSTAPGSTSAATARAIGCSEACSSDAATSRSSSSATPGAGVDGDDGHLAAGDGAGLVEHDGVDPAGRLEHLRPLDQDAELGAAAGADHERSRRREPEGARAGDDQHGHGRGERRATEPPVQQPAGERGERQPDDGRDEPRRDAVGQPLHLGLALLRLLDEPSHLGQRVSAPTAVARTTRRPPWLIVAPVTASPGDHLDGHGLAGQHRLVHRGGAVDDHAVGGDLLAGPYDELVTSRRSARGIRLSTPSRRTVTSRMPRSISARSAALDWVLALASR